MKMPAQPAGRPPFAAELGPITAQQRKIEELEVLTSHLSAASSSASPSIAKKDNNDDIVKDEAADGEEMSLVQQLAASKQKCLRSLKAGNKSNKSCSSRLW